MIKKVLKFIFTIFFILIIISLLYLGKVYFDYQHLVSQQPLDITVEKVRNKSNFTKIDDISKEMINSVVASEDRRFFERNGLDLRALARAIVTNVKTGKFMQGGSTITQQVAKSLYFDHLQSFDDRIIQIYILYDLEANYSKDEILELYLNNIYYGSGYYTLYDASMGYFNVKPSELNYAQSTLLTTVLPAPSVYDLKRNYNVARKYQSRVVYDLVETHHLTNQEAKEILDTEVKIMK